MLGLAAMGKSMLETRLDLSVEKHALILLSSERIFSERSVLAITRRKWYIFRATWLPREGGSSCRHLDFMEAAKLLAKGRFCGTAGGKRPPSCPLGGFPGRLRAFREPRACPPLTDPRTERTSHDRGNQAAASRYTARQTSSLTIVLMRLALPWNLYCTSFRKMFSGGKTASLPKAFTYFSQK